MGLCNQFIIQEQCISLGLLNRQVVFSFALDTIPVVITNPLTIDDDVWYHVFATRYLHYCSGIATPEITAKAW